MKRAIVFGASGTIGHAIANELATDGWSLYLHYQIHGEKVTQLQQQLTQQYPQQDFMELQFDFRCNEQAIVEFCKSLLPVNGLVFAQGITDYNLFAQESFEQIDQIMTVNFLTPIKLIHELEATLMRQEFARIVLIGSVYGQQASPMESVYSASKAALSRFTQGYAREVAAANLTINVIAPGAVASQMTAQFSQTEMADVIEEIPAARLARGNDISFWVRNIFTPQSNYFTGQTLYVDGGWLV